MFCFKTTTKINLSWITWLFIIQPLLLLRARISLLPQPLPGILFTQNDFYLLGEPGFVLSLDLHIVPSAVGALFWHSNLSARYLHQERGKVNTFYCQSYVLSQMSISQQLHKVDTFILFRHREDETNCPRSHSL